MNLRQFAVYHEIMIVVYSHDFVRKYDDNFMLSNPIQIDIILVLKT